MPSRMEMTRLGGLVAFQGGEYSLERQVGLKKLPCGVKTPGGLQQCSQSKPGIIDQAVIQQCVGGPAGAGQGNQNVRKLLVRRFAAADPVVVLRAEPGQFFHGFLAVDSGKPLFAGVSEAKPQEGEGPGPGQPRRDGARRGNGLLKQGCRALSLAGFLISPGGIQQQFGPQLIALDDIYLLNRQPQEIQGVAADGKA
jgi:hypothetical protein